MNNADRYAKIVYWSEENNCFVGCCPRLVIGGCHGDDPKSVFAELCVIVAEAVELYEKDGRPLPPPDSDIDWPKSQQIATA